MIVNFIMSHMIQHLVVTVTRINFKHNPPLAVSLLVTTSCDPLLYASIVTPLHSDIHFLLLPGMVSDPGSPVHGYWSCAKAAPAQHQDIPSGMPDAIEYGF